MIAVKILCGKWNFGSEFCVVSIVDNEQEGICVFGANSSDFPLLCKKYLQVSEIMT